MSYGATVGEALIDGITAALLGVRDTAPHRDLYCGQLGFTVAGSGAVPAATAAALWGDGLGDVPVTVLTAAGAATGRIALLTVDAAQEPQHPYTADLGLQGIDVYTRDIKATHTAVLAAGYRWQAPPQTYEVPLDSGQTVAVTEGICLAPDGTLLVFVEPANPRGTTAWTADPARECTELTSVVCHVPDPEREIAFWTSLGLSLWYDVTFSATGLEQMAGLPAGTRMRLAFLAGPATARIEVTSVNTDASGVDRRAAQRPGRALGHSGWLVRCRDLDEAIARSTSSGASLAGGPVATDDPLLGTGRAAAVLTPNAIPVTFTQS